MVQTLGDGTRERYASPFLRTVLTHYVLTWSWAFSDVVSKATPDSYYISECESQGASISLGIVFTQTHRAKVGVKVSCRARSSQCGGDEVDTRAGGEPVRRTLGELSQTILWGLCLTFISWETGDVVLHAL